MKESSNMVALLTMEQLVEGGNWQWGNVKDFYLHLNTKHIVYCRKGKNKEKETGKGPF